MTHHDTHDAGSLQDCIALCTQCHAVCLETSTYCLALGGEHAVPEHIQLLLACADICQTSADTMRRGVDVHAHTCAACAEICLHCAESCDDFGSDPRMSHCADVCRRCAESCRSMAA
jgi:hypothetical protein